MHPRAEPKIGELEDPVHDPHDLVAKPNPGGENGHEQGDISSGLVIGENKETMVLEMIKTGSTLCKIITSRPAPTGDHRQQPAEEDLRCSYYK